MTPHEKAEEARRDLILLGNRLAAAVGHTDRVLLIARHGDAIDRALLLARLEQAERDRDSWVEHGGEQMQHDIDRLRREVEEVEHGK